MCVCALPFVRSCVRANERVCWTGTKIKLTVNGKTTPCEREDSRVEWTAKRLVCDGTIHPLAGAFNIDGTQLPLDTTFNISVALNETKLDTVL